MAFDTLSIQKYLSSPEDFSEYPSPLGDKSLKALSRLLSRLYTPVSIKWHRIKKIKRALIDEGILRDFSLNLEWKLKTQAYMKDGDGVYFTLGLMITRTPGALLPICLHELSHIWLSQREDYPALKAFQREFKKNFGEVVGCDLISPIEIYANLVTLRWLRSICECTEKKRLKASLQKTVDDRSEKLALLKDRISQLEI